MHHDQPTVVAPVRATRREEGGGRDAVKDSRTAQHNRTDTAQQYIHGSLHTLAVLLQELQVQEGGDVSFLAADYQALLGDAQPQASSTGSDQQAATTSADSAGPEKDAGLDEAVGSIMCLFQDCVRFSTGATGAVQRLLPGLDKLLRSEAGGVCSLQAAVEYMSRAL